MPVTTEIKLPDEFASTMQQLVAEAEKATPPRTDFATHADSDAIRRELVALNQRLAGLEQALANSSDKNAPTVLSGEAEIISQLQRMDQHMIALRNTESVNQRLFNSLHQELKNYRDNFLRESLQKPFIRDLVVLFDDLSSLANQMETTGGSADAKAGILQQWHANLQNAIHSLLEVLHRMEVNLIEPKEMVDRSLHRVVSYEPADFAEDDGRIVMRIKRGFIWHDQVLRPEEVVAKRYN